MLSGGFGLQAWLCTWHIFSIPHTVEHLHISLVKISFIFLLSILFYFFLDCCRTRFYFLFSLTMFIFMQQNTKANSLYMKPYLAINLILS